MIVEFGVHFAALVLPIQPALPPPPPPPVVLTAMDEYVLADPMPFVAWPIIADAMADAPPVPCGDPTFYVEPMEWAGFASSDCTIHLSPDIWETHNLDWYAPQVVRHEIAHLLTMGEPEMHGTQFRAVLAALLAPIRLSEVYGDPTSEYPTQWWRDGTCLYGCPVSPPAPRTLLQIAQEAVGQTPGALYEGLDSFWCADFAEHILLQVGWVDPEEFDSPSNLRNSLTPVTDPQPGDLVFFSFQAGSGQNDHVAIVESLEPLVVIDGNGASRNQVGRWTPSADYHVSGFARP